MAPTAYQECDSCGHQAGGYSRSELEKIGWQWNAVTETSYTEAATYFVLCDECVVGAEHRARDRVEREQRASVPRGTCTHCKGPTTIIPPPSVVVGTPFKLALPTAVCPNCDKNPALLRPVEEYPADALYPPDA